MPELHFIMHELNYIQSKTFKDLKPIQAFSWVLVDFWIKFKKPLPNSLKKGSNGNILIYCNYHSQLNCLKFKKYSKYVWKITFQNILYFVSL